MKRREEAPPPERPGHGLNWFQQMGGYVQWRIVPPSINTPFSTPLPDKLLAELATNRDSLRARMNVKCLCDGFEILEVRNLKAPSLWTDHPCLSSVSSSQLLGYFGVIGLQEQIDDTIERVQDEIRKELNLRERAGGKASEHAKTIKRRKALEEKEKADQEKAGESIARIIRK